MNKENLSITQKTNTNQQESCKRHTIFNLSKYTLTDAETSLLERGLKFIPTKPHVDISKLLADLREWERRMRLMEYFHEDGQPITNTQQTNKEDIQMKISAREKNKIFMPTSGRDVNLDLYIEMVKEDILTGIQNSKEANLTQSEQKALKQLMNNDSIIIRPADKGSGIVVMDTQEYIKKVEDDLQSNNTYKRLTNNRLTTVNNKVKKMVKEMHS